MRVLGIDPGLATVGIGLIESSSPQDMRCEDWLTITTRPKRPIHERLDEIARDLEEYLSQTKPDLIAIEEVYFSVNEKTAIDVAQARGVLLHVASRHVSDIIEVGPLQLKSTITGDGNADKRQVQDMVMHILNLTERPRPDDAADALALAVFGALHGIPTVAG